MNKLNTILEYSAPPFHQECHSHHDVHIVSNSAQGAQRFMHKPVNLLVVFIGRRKMVGTLEKLKRALVALIVSLARAYNCGVQINRTSSDEEVRSAYRRLSRCVHPDRPGGNTDDQT